ncbi:protein phosphatase 1 regulatory subunit 16A [Hetaerina americana]|uniref:protein phosphatase 1 regulatory subunit 16A n=1 Tax=Hetaerina americana TaxID=62018 RepID=UPI003A7F1F63
MEHADLVSEMSQVERMSTQDRLRQARHRRIQQLKIWSQREKEWMRRGGGSGGVSSGNPNPKGSRRSIFFSDSVVLLEAAARNDVDEVRRLLMKGVSPDSTNEDGLTALHQCCIDDNEEMMKLLIEYGANVNAEDSERWTPLHAAATCGHLHLVQYLISKGANLLAVNADGNMPYDICEDEAALDCIEGEMARRGVTQELIDDTRAATELKMLDDMQEVAETGAQSGIGPPAPGLETPDRQGATPLHIASANGYVRVVEFLLEQHVSTDVRDEDGWSPAHAAACWGHLEVLEMLAHSGADLEAKTKHDETPTDICEDPELRERIGQLLMEQETRRKQEAGQRRLRRSQSNNKRTQSVRRTSIRDKNLTTKKDTQEEAKLMLLAHEGYAAAGDVSSLPGPSNVVSLINGLDGPQFPQNSNMKSSLSDSGRRVPAEGQDSDHEVIREWDNGNWSGIDDSFRETSPLGFPSTEASYVTQEAGNGKINIHVSVTINPGTLADLKKQRAQIRNGPSSLDGSIVRGDSISSGGGSLPKPQLKSSLSSPTISLGSPQLPINRFSGQTGEVVGDEGGARRCCVVS